MLLLTVAARPAAAGQESWRARILDAAGWGPWVELGPRELPPRLPEPAQLLARLQLRVPAGAEAVEMMGSRLAEDGRKRRVSLWRAPGSTVRALRLVDGTSVELTVGTRPEGALEAAAGAPELPATVSTITGKLLYRDRVFDLAGYTGATRPLPLRHLRVELTRTSDDSLLASTTSAADGSFLLSFEPAAPIGVRIRILSEVEGLPGGQVRVLDRAGVGGDLSQAQPLIREVVQIASLGPGVALDLSSLLLSDDQQGDTLAAFNLLDCLLDAVELLEEPGWLGAAPSALPAAIWSPSSTQATSVYQDGVFRIASPAGGDDDSWSDSILLALVGEWFLQTYGRVDSNLGFGGLDLDRDPLSAFGDGASIVFASLVRQHRALTRQDDDGQPADDGVSVFADLGYPPPLGFPGSGQDGFDLETRALSYGDTVAPRGQRSVSNVAAMLWDLVDDVNTPDGVAQDDDLRSDAGVDGGARFYQITTSDLVALPGLEPISYEDFHEAWRTEYGEDSALFQIAVTQGRTALFDDAFEPDGDWQQLVAQTPWVQPEPSASAGVVIGEVYLGDSDWVELTNAGQNAVALQGFSVVAHRNGFSTGNERIATVPAGFVLLPGRSVVLHEGGSVAADTELDLFFPSWSIPWKEGADGACTLMDGAANAVDFLRWDATQPSGETVPAGLTFSGTLDSPGFGSSLARDSLATDTDSAADFQPKAPTPRAPNASFMGLHTLRPRGDKDHLRLNLALDDLCYVLAAGEREAPLSVVSRLDTLGIAIEQADSLPGANHSTLLKFAESQGGVRVFELKEKSSVRIATAVSWGAWIPWGAVVVHAVQNLSATAHLQSLVDDPVNLSWTNDGVYDSLQITLDSQPLATVPDTTQSFQTQAGAGHHVFTVVPWYTGVSGPKRTARVFVGSTPCSVATGFEPGDPSLFDLTGFAVVDENFSGTKALLDHADLVAPYASNDTAVAELADPVDLTSQSVLNFTHAAHLALDGDYAAVELSLDDGETWQEIARYLGSDHDGTDGANWTDLVLDPADWISESLDLSAYAGKRARFRFVRISDASGTSLGWIIDNVFFGTDCGNTLWVSNTGSDDFGCGHPERPFATIAAAAAASAVGDTLHLAAGTFSATVDLLLDGSQRPVNAALPPGRSLVGEGMGASVLQVAPLGTGIYAGPASGWAPGDSAVVRGLSLRTGSRGLRVDAGVVQAEDLGFDGQGTAILVEGGRAEIDRALITAAGRAARQSGGSLSLRHSTLTGMERALFIQSGVDSTAIETSIFSQITKSVIELEAGAPPPLVACNDFYGLSSNPESFTGLADPRGIDGNLAVPPYYCDPYSGDYQLSSQSPLLNAPGCGLIGAFGEGCALTVVSAPPSPSRTRILSNQPNPFNPSTRIRFELARPTRVEMKVYDARGRELATLLSGDLPAGEHFVDWNGKDARGGSLASGVYYLRLSAKGSVSTRALVLLK